VKRENSISNSKIEISDSNASVSEPMKMLLRQRVAGFLHGLALGGERFLKRAKDILPKRMRKRARCQLDDCASLGFAPAGGVRDNNKEPAA
jgi:hypothetical protein